jgi:1-deoxy-D-xylulose-5-phosphate reductoisomerase
MSRSTTNLVLLGSTGSIGIQTLDVIAGLRRVGKAFRVVALSGHANHELLAEQIEAVRPDVVAVAAGQGARWLHERFPHVRVLEGDGGPAELAALEGVDVVVNAIVGAAGLAATLAALSRGRTVALANKESLVIGGPLVRAALTRHGGRLIPVDSEHSALLQCLDAGRRDDVRRLILTASGGPFLNVDPAARASATAKDALRHPTWSMGRRVTIDSATLVNKAFEVIEAHVLFDVPYDRISVVIHPESIVHSLVEFCDGSIVAQAATHDMRIPIQYALTYPERVDTGRSRLDVAALGRLEFRHLQEGQFPAFATVLAAALAGGSAPAAVNAADEVLVGRFLRGDIVYGDLAVGLAATLARWRTDVADSGRPLDLSTVESVDRWARSLASVLRFDHR